MDSTISELYFLIAKFLSGGPCQRASQTLIEELESNEIIPKSVNWLGQGITQDYKTFSSKFNHINTDHLPKLLEQLIKIVNAREHASTVASRSLLSSSTLALLDKTDLSSRKSSTLTWSKKHVSQQVRQFKNKRNLSNPVHAIAERSISGNGVGNDLIKPEFYQRMAIACNTLGHLSAVYCVLFDVTGKYIFTGADDHLVKIWSAIDGRLLFTFRGTTSEVTDLAVNQENTLIAVASCDKTIRVWCLRTCAPVAVLTAHSGNVTSVFFCPIPRSRSVIRYLASTSTDGSCAFWAYTDDPGEPIQFQPKPTLYLERMRPGSAQMICSSFSPGGCFMAAGSADNHVRVYHMLGTDGPERILEVEHHTERVDSISWAHEGIKFVSGSKDGTALIWRFDSGCWRYIRLHCGKNPGEPAVIFEDPKRRPRVTMVGWNADDSLVLTAVSDHMIKVWNSTTGELIRVLKGHSDEAYVIEAHPFNSRVVCTAGHDGKLIIWDVGTSRKDDKDPNIGKVYEYYNQLGEGHGHGSLFDCKWSPDGFSIAMTDSHGHMMLLTVSGDQIKMFKKLPSELFFHTDYRPIIRDAITHQILDEQTQVAPHLMPPPFLVDVDGNPYPPPLQRLVPGRERLKEEYLIPNVAVGASGFQEVIEGIPVRSNIDEMIHQLAIEQGLARNREAAERENERSRGIGNRRSGEVEGVRQSRGDWQTGDCSIARKYVIPPLPDGVAESLEEFRHSAVEAEETYYRDQSSKMSPLSSSNVALGSPVDCSPNGRARRLRMLARDAAERRRNQPPGTSGTAPDFLETEGVARPNPRPQMEISVSQESPRRPTARRTNRNPVTSRRPRPVRFDVRRTLREHGESDMENVELEEDSFSEAHVSTTESSSSEDSDSDWGGTLGTSRTREENKRKATAEGRKRSQRIHSNSSGEDSTTVKQEPEESEGGDANDDNEPQPGPSTDIKVKTEPGKTTRIRKARSKQVDYSGGLEEIPELYRPSEWLSEILPKRSPYLPQLGDDLVYYRQGHEAYIKEVEAKKTYTIPNKLKKQLPYVQKPDLEPEVSVRVIAIKFELEPPRLVALKLARTDWQTGELINGSHFYVKYHDIADVVDFLIIRQMYDRSTGRRWNDGDKFRCLIQGEWWLGTIVSRSPYSPEYQDSNYLCYEVKWNSGEPERMSPWDMDIVTDDFEIPSDYDPNDGIPASSEDLRIGMYESTVGDWPPHGHQEAQCQKISLLMEQVMALAISEAFLTPVDLNMYPDYAHTIEYPIDLSTIKARLDNLFYRRVDALRFDIKYIAMNAEKFNQLDSAIVKNARVIRDVCLEITNNPDTVDVSAFYHTTQKKYSNASKAAKSDGSGGSKSKTSSSRQSKKFKKKDKEIKDEYISEEEQVAWEAKCLEILNDIFERDDATPFRQPVDITVFPDYSRVIDTPMDLQTVREELLGGNYESPQDFNKDMTMIFSNSRHYNTDIRSKIYQMTRRVQSVYESRFNEFMRSMKRKRKGKRSASKVKDKESSKNKSRFMPSRSSNSTNSTPRKNPKRSATAKNRFSTHEEESSDALDDSGHFLRNRSRSATARNSPSVNGTPRKGFRNGHAGPSNSKTNGYGSSSPQRYSTRTSSGARPVKRLRISSGESHPSTRNSPRRGMNLTRLSNTSHGSSTTPDGPSTSRAALKRVKMTTKDEPSDEFEDSDDSVSMPVLNEEHDRSGASDYDSDDHHMAVRRSSRVILKRSHDWDGRSTRETRNQGRQRPNYAEPQDATEDEDERRFGKRRRLPPTRTSPMRAVSTRPIPSQPPPLRKSNSFNDSESEQDEENQEDSEVSDEEFDPDKPGPSSKLIRQMNRTKKVTNGNSKLRNGKGKSAIKNALGDEDEEEASEDAEEEHAEEEESEEEGGSDEEGESEDEDERGKRRKQTSKPQPRYSPRKTMIPKRRQESSDDEYTSSPSRRKAKASGSRGGNRRATRGVKVNYGEGSDDDDSEPTRVTVSSRGRVRRTKSFLGD